MRTGRDEAQLNDLEAYLKKLGLYENRNYYPNPGFSLAQVRGLSYVEIWKTHLRQLWYDFRFDDNSLLFFHQDGCDISYSYLGCPYMCMAHSEYKDAALQAGMSSVEIEESYENYLFTCELKDNPNYYRYDYDERTYRHGEHPVAHIHCGLMEGIRIGLKKKLDIISYVAFVLRQAYVHKWNVVLNNEAKYSGLFRFKSNLDDIKPDFYKEWDKNQDFYMV